MATQTGPRLTIAGSCDGCCHLRGEEKVSRPRLIVSYVYHCGQPTMLKVHPFGAKPRKIGRTPATPAWCPELSAARLALARSVVAAATDDVLCSKCGKPVTTADEKSYRMHSMAGCPR